jgi:plastocyanin
LKQLLRTALLPAFLLLFSLAALSCKDNKNPMNPGGGGTTPDVLITIVANAGSSSYSPNPANVTVGQTVAWKNSAGTTHTATQVGGGFDTGNVANGATSGLITITTSGDLAYQCSIHPTMTGTLHVTP